MAEPLRGPGAGERLLRQAALSAEGRPFYLASALRVFRDRRGLTPIELAAWLGASPEQMVLLALCRRPRASDPTFQADVQAIAARFGLDAARLGNILASVAEEEVRQRGARVGGALLRAARQHDKRWARYLRQQGKGGE